MNAPSIPSIIVPLFRLEPDGSETCFRVGVAAGQWSTALERQLEASPVFRYLPNHRVTRTTQLPSRRVAEVGPRLAIETPFSSTAVEIMQAIGFSEVQRVEQFRRFVIPGDVPATDFLSRLVFDRVTECVYQEPPQTFTVDTVIEPVQEILLLTEGIEGLRQFSVNNNLGFDDYQLDYIQTMYLSAHKNPTDISLFQLAQMWSDHCRHLRFNARLVIDGVELSDCLFDLVRSPYQQIKDDCNVVIGFHDNASAIRGREVELLVPSRPGWPSPYVVVSTVLHPTISAETHNYPAGVAPFPGTATEIGGEIRDQIGAGHGSDISYACCGRVLGSILFPSGYRIPGELVRGRAYTYPADKATPLEIALKGSAGWHQYANCFGRPCVGGFFYTGATWRPRRKPDGQIGLERVESLKPVCYGLGGGTIRAEHLGKGAPTAGMKIVQIGGPAFPIGFCGGSGSSSISGTNTAGFDQNAVQRGNPEMERRVYQVLLTCIAMGSKNPIVSLHDQGAGGIANVLTELIESVGGRLYLGSVRRGDPTMPDVKIWVCEYQERMGLLIAADDVSMLEAICVRENCPCEVLGEVSGDGHLVVYSQKDTAEVVALGARPIIDILLSDALTDLPRMTISDQTAEDIRLPLVVPPRLTVKSALNKVLRRTEVGSKEWAIMTVDGSIGGQVIRNQRCGPFALPVNDCAIVALSRLGRSGQATSLGLAPYLTVLNPAAGARMAITEMLTNLMGAYIGSLQDVQCICNWMWPASLKPPDGEIARMVAAAQAAEALLKRLGIAIIGGKDSSSMATKVPEDLIQQVVKSLETIVFGSLAVVPDVSCHITPDLKYPGQSTLVQLDIANGQRRLGGSSFAQCLDGQLGDNHPDLDEPDLLIAAFGAMQELLRRRLVSAGHDISDGGLVTTVAEMCFAAGCGVQLNLRSELSPFNECFAQEAGYVIEVPVSNWTATCGVLQRAGVPCQVIGQTTRPPVIQVSHNNRTIINDSTVNLKRVWEQTGHQFAILRINPQIAEQERMTTTLLRRPAYKLPFEPTVEAPVVVLSSGQYKVAVIREQGSNGHDEMIHAWTEAGFETTEVHMNDLRQGRLDGLDRFRVAVFPGGFTFGDHFGAAVGWAASTLLDPRISKVFADFQARPDTLSFGVCNGAQYGLRCGWAPLPDLPAEQRPYFTLNQSRSFIHRWILLRVANDTPAIMLQGMAGSVLGAYVANAEGYFNCDHAPEVLDRVMSENLAPLLYVDPRGKPTTKAPYSPSGSTVAGVCDPTGRHLYMMPHAFDRGFDLRLWPYVPPEWRSLKTSPWLEMGHNARRWCDANRL